MNSSTDISDLSSSLKEILEREMELGNRVVRIDRPAGTECPLAVVMERPLKRHITENSADGSALKHWESLDPHYPQEAGYKCLKTGHIISGPIVEKQKYRLRI